MRWVTYRSADGAERAGLLQNARAHGLDASLLALIESGGGLAAAAERAVTAPVEVVDLADVQLCAPIPRPPSVRDFLSFEEHLRNAEAALRAKDLLRQLTQADLALQADPRNKRAKFLYGDALIKYNQVERGCTYLRAVGAKNRACGSD